MFRVKLHAPRWLTKAEVKVLGGLANLKILWSIWNLRCLILLSLGLQIILILFAPFRKKTANTMVVITIWLAYLLADYVAIQAVGLIPNYSTSSSAAAYTTKPDLLSFWAPFLLVHLGGPDAITALSLEDNELWLRTVLHFFTYISATGRVFFQSLPANLLSIPTILMFFTGFLKYLERTLSLYNARMSQFKSTLLTDQDSDPNQLANHTDNQPEELLNENFDDGEMSVKRNVQLLDQGGDEEEEEEEDYYSNAQQRINCCFPFFRFGLQRSNVIRVWDAYSFFEKYKGVYADLTLSLHDRNKSRAYFLQPTLTPEAAFNVLEIELNFTYEVFFTKMIVIHQSFGTWIRRVSFSLQVSSLLIWIVFIDKKPFQMFDIWITYTLLAGAVLIDSIAFLMVFLSDWQVAMLSRSSKLRVTLYDKLLSARERTWGGFWEAKEASWTALLKRMLCRRWSESLQQFNLIDSSARPCSNFTNSIFKYLPPVKNQFQEFKYVSRKWFANDLRDFIVDQIRYKAEMADELVDAYEICGSKGEWVIRTLGGLDLDPFVFYKWTVDVEYDKCVLLWHVATEILYQTDNDGTIYPKFCKILSDYMMYLFKWQPEMITAVAGTSEVRIQDTSNDATLQFEKVLHKAKKEEMKKERVRNVCKTLMDADEDTKKYMKGRRKSKSVLLEAVRLAKELRNLKEGKKKRKMKVEIEEEETETVEMWELMAKVWVELMCYSASNTRPSAHAAQLKQGGELLSLVWLLMLHLGLSKNFHTTQDDE